MQTGQSPCIQQTSGGCLLCGTCPSFHSLNRATRALSCGTCLPSILSIEQQGPGQEGCRKYSQETPYEHQRVAGCVPSTTRSSFTFIHPPCVFCRPHIVIGISPKEHKEGGSMPQHPGPVMSTETGFERSEGSDVGRAEGGHCGECRGLR